MQAHISSTASEHENQPVVSTASIQKRLKKEKKAKRKLQEALEFESKRRERVEDALKHSSSSSPSPEPLHANNNNNNNGMRHNKLMQILASFCWLAHPANTRLAAQNNAER